jgi:copper chaperone CopZ
VTEGLQPLSLRFNLNDLERSTVMKKTFKLEDLDCANCAAKMETAINKLEGVKKATVSFMTQKLTIEAEDDKFDEVVQAAVKCIAKVEPDCRVILK